MCQNEGNGVIKTSLVRPPLRYHLPIFGRDGLLPDAGMLVWSETAASAVLVSGPEVLFAHGVICGGQSGGHNNTAVLHVARK